VNLVVEKSGHTLGIDFIGAPGAFTDAFSLNRYRMLARAGLDVFPLPWSTWNKDPDACLHALESRLAP
jgi:hypothetical protein